MMAALSRFISKLGERGMSFYKMLRKADGFQWDDQAASSICSTQVIFEVVANPNSTTTRRCPAIICGGDRCSSQHRYLCRTIRRFNRSQAVARVLCQQDLERRPDAVPTGAEGALRGSHDDQEAEALLLSAHSLSCVRSLASVLQSREATGWIAQWEWRSVNMI
jgi:hypothetical protein